MNVSIKAVTREDLPQLSWTGDSLHLRHIEECLEKRASEFYALWEEDEPVAFGGLNIINLPDFTYLWMLATRSDQQGKGFMRQLIGFMEKKSLELGARATRLAVEVDNSRAIRLYEFLGYSYKHDEIQSWFELGEDEKPQIYVARCFAYEKELSL